MVDSPFLEMSANTLTVLWNDSATPSELQAAISWGAVGATCNPVIALSALKAAPEYWAERIRTYAAAHPTATEDEIGWAMVRELSIEAAKLLEPSFDKYNGRNGRLSIQTDPRYYRDAKSLADQAVEFSQLARNVIVKIPVTAAGVVAIEDAVYRGVNINATVSFSVAQTIAVGDEDEVPALLVVRRWGSPGRLEDAIEVFAGDRPVLVAADVAPRPDRVPRLHDRHPTRRPRSR